MHAGWAGPAPPSLGLGASLPDLPAAGLGDKGQKGPQTGQDPSLGTEGAIFVLDHADQAPLHRSLISKIRWVLGGSEAKPPQPL